MFATISHAATPSEASTTNESFHVEGNTARIVVDAAPAFEMGVVDTMNLAIDPTIPRIVGARVGLATPARNRVETRLRSPAPAEDSTPARPQLVKMAVDLGGTEVA